MKEKQQVPADNISFGNYKFDRMSGLLKTRDGDELFMENRLRDLFSILLDNLGEFVSKDELMNLAWKKTIVTEQSVSKGISDLRKFFASNGLADLKITTIRKLGYRLEHGPQGPSSKTTFTKLLPYAVILFVLLIILGFLH